MRYGFSSLGWISPFSTSNADLLRKAADMGFHVFEIAAEDLSLLDVPVLKRAAREANISIPLGGAFGPGRDMSSDDASIRKDGIAYTMALIDMANALEEPYVMGPMYSAVGKARQLPPDARAEQLKWAVDNVGDCAVYAKSKGIRLAIEPLNRFETDMINTADQGLAFIGQIGMDNVGLNLDTFHMNIEEKSITGAIRKCGKHLFAFHSCANDRGTPGQDNFDWQAIKEALRDASYQGALVIESFTPDCVEIAKAASIWRQLADSPEALARDGIRFLRSVFDADPIY